MISCIGLQCQMPVERGPSHADGLGDLGHGVPAGVEHLEGNPQLARGHHRGPAIDPAARAGGGESFVFSEIRSPTNSDIAASTSGSSLGLPVGVAVLAPAQLR